MKSSSDYVVKRFPMTRPSSCNCLAGRQLRWMHKARGAQLQRHANTLTRLFFCDLRRRRRGSVSTMTPHQCWCISGLKKKTTCTAEEEEKPLLPATANSHLKGGPASFRPSELLYKHNGTFETKGIAHSKQAQGVHNATKIRKRRIPTSPLSPQRPVTLSSLLLFLSPHPFSFIVTPVHGAWRAFSATKGLLAATSQLPSACISWHNMSRAMRQLSPTLAKSQSSRTREIFAPDWSCPITFRARLSTLCSHCSDNEVPASASPSTTHLFHLYPNSGD